MTNPKQAQTTEAREEIQRHLQQMIARGYAHGALIDAMGEILDQWQR